MFASAGPLFASVGPSLASGEGKERSSAGGAPSRVPGIARSTLASGRASSTGIVEVPPHASAVTTNQTQTTRADHKRSIRRPSLFRRARDGK
jgi:hypothetical protein